MRDESEKFPDYYPDWVTVKAVKGPPISRGRAGRGAPRRHEALYHWIPLLEPGQEIRLPFSHAVRASALNIAKKLGVKIFTAREGSNIRIYRPRPEDSKD